MLSALARSSSLPTITHLVCSRNYSWFYKGKESNVELFSDAIRAMKNLKHLHLNSGYFETWAFD